MAPPARIIAFSSRPPNELRLLLDHLQRQLTNAKVCAVLYERRPWGPPTHSFRTIDIIFRFLHACPRDPNGPVTISLKDLGCYLQQQSCELFVTADGQSLTALAFLERHKADLGVVFGAGLPTPSLARAPRLGWIGLKSWEVLLDRREGPTRLWQFADDGKAITVAVRKISDSEGTILRQATIPVAPYDDLQSLALKAEVTSRDLVVAAIGDCLAENSSPTPAIDESSLARDCSTQEALLHESRLQRPIVPYSPKRTRPIWKLLFRSIVLLPFAVVRNWTYRWRRAFPIVIFYHHVISDRPHHLGTPTAAFARQIAFLRKFYRIASLEQAMQMLQSSSVPAPTIVLTFDDGYADNFLNLRAVAEHYSIPVFLFLSTQHMESGSPFGHDVKRKQTEFLPLSWHQVRSLSRAGFSFGCHTRSHFDCGSSDEAKLAEEIAGSKSDLGSQAGIWTDYFSFPWGMPENISNEALRLAKASFPYVFAAAGGVNVIGTDTRAALLRREDHPASLWEVELSAQCLLNMKSWRDLFPGIF